MSFYQKTAACLACPAGVECTAGATNPCGTGSYSLVAEMSCTQCPIGSSCAEKDVAPVPCPAGTHTNSFGGATSCNLCDPGNYCPDPT